MMPPSSMENPATALVYPPFGPAGLPNLGLALLGGTLKEQGYRCRTFYWNLEFLAEHLPRRSIEEALTTYRFLTGRGVYPFNEWIFAHLAYEDPSCLPTTETLAMLDDTAEQLEKRFGGLVTRELILDLRENAHHIVDGMARKLVSFDIVGINTTFYQNAPALALARRVKQLAPDTWVVLGGANTDGEMGAALLHHFPYVDRVFSGEVDRSFPAWVESLAGGAESERLPGLLQRCDGEVIGSPAPPEQDLDSLAHPDFDDYAETRERIGIADVEPLCLALESSRGCWWGTKSHCSFCGLNAQGMSYRRKDQQRFRDEVVQMVRRYSTRFFFMTDNILAMDYYDDFMTWAAEAGLDVHYFYEIKSNAKRGQVERLADAGITAVQPGIESFSSRVLKLMGKGVTGAHNLAFLKYAREYGVMAVYNILGGFPGEDPDEYYRLAENLPALQHLRPPSGVVPIEFHRFSPYHQDPARYGIRLRPSPRYRHIYPFSEREIARIAYMFVRDDEPDLSYLGPVRKRVAEWKRLYDPEDCTLTWKDGGFHIDIDDRRPSFEGRRYRLSGWAVELFHLLDRPCGLPAILRQAKQEDPENQAGSFLCLLFGAATPEVEDYVHIHFTREEFLDSPEVFLDLLTELGLLFRDGDTYLALPVRQAPREAPVDWLAVGV